LEKSTDARPRLTTAHIRMSGDAVYLEATILDVSKKRRQGYNDTEGCKKHWTNVISREGCHRPLDIFAPLNRPKFKPVPKDEIAQNLKTCADRLNEVISGCALEQFVSHSIVTAEIPLGSLQRDAKGQPSALQVNLPKFLSAMQELQAAADVSKLASRETIAINVLNGLETWACSKDAAKTDSHNDESGVDTDTDEKSVEDDLDTKIQNHLRNSSKSEAVR
jgi:hypothetical protein